MNKTRLPRTSSFNKLPFLGYELFCVEGEPLVLEFFSHLRAATEIDAFLDDSAFLIPPVACTLLSLILESLTGFGINSKLSVL